MTGPIDRETEVIRCREKQSMIRKRKNSFDSDDDENSIDHIFPLLLAALSNKPDSATSIVNKCFKDLHSSFLSNPQQTLTFPLLALFPLLLTSKNDELACRAAEFIGELSLSSFERNMQIACDDGTVKALVSLLVSSSSRRKVSVAASNAVLDLSTTCSGRRSLLEWSALETCMSGLLQVSVLFKSVSICKEDVAHISWFKIVLKGDKLLALLFDTTVVLINSCCYDELERIPKKLQQCFVQSLQETWREVYNQMVMGKFLTSRRARKFYLSNITVNSLAECLFRLSINANTTSISPSNRVSSSIFDPKGTTCKEFLLNYWEVSPFLLGRLSSGLMEDCGILRSIKYNIDLTGSPYSFISPILKHLVSCPPIASDEVDILSFFKEVQNKLGCPLVYEQDIRVVRADKQLETEVHFFQRNLDCRIKKPGFLFIDDIVKCEEAFKEGYTIALRGLEFHFQSVASMANELASIFGQPSIGANLYLTPPNSQGLAVHYDDHCVFVCQLLGTKRWKISSESAVHLPRLYTPCDRKGIDSSLARCRNLLLTEGDVLYIPRGFLHEACTDDAEVNGSPGFSLHLTLAIEVEPPFEWEGFTHVALCCWSETQNHHTSAKSLSGILDKMSINLLHVLIGLIGESNHNFRKACLAAAETDDWIFLNQKTTFKNLIDMINLDSRFLEALKMVELEIEKDNDEDPFHRMRWLQFLGCDGQYSKGHDENIPFIGIENLFQIYAQHRNMAEAAFMQVKNRFCSEVSFEKSLESYKKLLDKYKKVRKQYMNGMLSLHSHIL